MLLVVAAVFQVALAAIQPALRWVQLDTPTLPSPRRGEFTLSPWTDDKAGRLVLFGGCDLSFSTFYNDVWMSSEIRPGVVDWRLLDTTGEVPAARCGHGAAIIDGSMYVFGGLTRDGVTDHLNALDLHTKVWRRLIPAHETAQWPPARNLLQHSMVVAPGGFVIASGMSDVDGDDGSAFHFSLSSKAWTRFSDGQCNTSRVAGSAAVWSQNSASPGLFVLGGFANGAVLDMLLFLNMSAPPPSTRSPRQFAPLGNVPSKLGQVAFAGAEILSGGRFVAVYGGFGQAAISPDVWLWDLAQGNSGDWCQLVGGAVLGPLPPGHFAAGWARLSDSVYAFGGRIHPLGHPEALSEDLWRLDIVGDLGIACGWKDNQSGEDRRILV